ncbi:ankyrin repeat domain-containing protein [Erythrobacter sp. SCSIO 43205]|uniref:ankyrin repeat domain-containing protein n=1 Tax=Erythrobacter sp. SCSIO 43205 TaxID=2779361 RepID=UPI002102C847|nr:ankyrin repeat domain-containing protein [Erythrobacter sp. SCSIO 43205]
MGSPVLRNIGSKWRVALAALAGVFALAALQPAAAQIGGSDGYQFLKAVKERDGDTATKMLDEPGTQIVNTRDITTGENGLHIVAQRRDTLWMRFLLQRGANPNVRDRNGTTPLQIAVRLGHIEGVEALIKGGAQVDISDSAGETPLMTAVHQRNVELVRTLLAEGADPDINDNTGRSARDHMERMNSNTLLLREFEEADKKREENPAPVQYGPSF